MSNQRGFVLIQAMFLLFVAAGLSAALLARGRALDAAAEHDLVDLRATHAAEGGLAWARHALARDAAYPGESLSVGRCIVEISVKAVDDGWRVAVVARPGGHRIDATLEPDQPYPRVVRRRERGGE